jgi:hypothetical protein
VLFSYQQESSILPQALKEPDFLEYSVGFAWLASATAK